MNNKIPIKHWRFKQEVALVLLNGENVSNTITSDTPLLTSDQEEENPILRNQIKNEHKKERMVDKPTKCFWVKPTGKKCRNNTLNACKSCKIGKQPYFLCGPHLLNHQDLEYKKKLQQLR